MRTPVLALLLLGACSEQAVGVYDRDPTVVITSHSAGDLVLDGVPTEFRAQAGDADDDSATLAATWYAGSERACERTNPDETGLTTCEITLTLAMTDPVVRVEVSDPSGAGAVDEVRPTVVPFDGPTGDAPTVQWDAPEDGGTSAQGPLAFQVTVADRQDAPTDLTLVWTSSLDGVFSAHGADSSGVAAFVDAGRSPGTHVFTVRATDRDGLFSEASVVHTIDAPPSAPVVSIAPDPATSAQDLQATVDAPSVDPDGDSVVYRYEWLVDGVTSSASTSALLPAAATTRGETWTVRVTPTAGLGTGPAGQASVVIENSPPTLVSLDLSPDPVRTDDVLTAVAVALDADGEVPTLCYAWTVDGVPAGANAPTLDGGLFDEGQVVEVTVTPSDGSAAGPAGVAALTVANTPPGAPGVAIVPTAPVEAVDDLVCSIPMPSVDADADPVTYALSWTVDGVPYAGQTTALAGDTVPAADTLTGETWTCTVVPTDDDEPGTPGVAAVVIGDTSFVPDYNGLFDVTPVVQYDCQFLGVDVVNFTVASFVFSEAGVTLTVTGAPTTMTSSPLPLDENFSVQGAITGGCKETYLLAGSFSDPDTWSGTFQVSFTGAQCGFTNCANQVWPVDGTRH